MSDRSERASFLDLRERLAQASRVTLDDSDGSMDGCILGGKQLRLPNGKIIGDGPDEPTEDESGSVSGRLFTTEPCTSSVSRQRPDGGRIDGPAVRGIDVQQQDESRGSTESLRESSEGNDKMGQAVHASEDSVGCSEANGDSEPQQGDQRPSQSETTLEELIAIGRRLCDRVPVRREDENNAESIPKGEEDCDPGQGVPSSYVVHVQQADEILYQRIPIAHSRHRVPRYSSEGECSATGDRTNSPRQEHLSIDTTSGYACRVAGGSGDMSTSTVRRTHPWRTTNEKDEQMRKMWTSVRAGLCDRNGPYATPRGTADSATEVAPRSLEHGIRELRTFGAAAHKRSSVRVSLPTMLVQGRYEDSLCPHGTFSIVTSSVGLRERRDDPAGWKSGSTASTTGRKDAEW